MPRYGNDRILFQYPLSNLAQLIDSQQIVYQGETVSAGVGRTTAEQTWDVSNDSLADWITACIGYAKSKGQGQGINRNLPAQHPQLKYLYVSGVGAEGLGPTGKDGSVATYKRWRTKLHYETPPYDIVADNNVQQECFRYITMINAQSNTEVFQRRQGCFAYSIQSGIGVTNRNALLIPESHGASQSVTKVAYDYLWVNLPDVGLFGGSGFSGSGCGSSQNIINGIGKVNNTSFLGFDPGTLLFDSWKPVSRTYPVEPILLGLQQWQVPRAWDVQLRFIYFNPPSGMKAAGTISGVPAVWPAHAQQGHNLVPHPTNGLWYLAYLCKGFTNSETDQQFYRYQGYNFYDMFKMNA